MMTDAEAHKRVEELEKRLEWVQAQNLAYARDLATLFQRERSELKYLKQTEMHLTHSDRLVLIGQLAASVAHDLANLITPILGYAQILLRKRDQVDAELVDIAERIWRASQRANLLLRQMVDLSSERTGNVEIVDLNKLLVEICEIFVVRLKHNAISISTHFANGPLNVVSNRVQLSQVFVNLFVNAVDAMPNGGKLRITTYTSQADEMACIEVTDTGTGIPLETLPLVFDPFFTTKPEGEGTGLGLSVSKEIITQYGGHIDVDSKLSHGTAFSVWLPTQKGEGVSS
jgi:signal transduction histidine kinase